MAKPTLTQLKNANTGDTWSWGLSPSYTLEVKEYVVTVNGVDYVRDNAIGRESGLVILANDFGLEG